MEKPHTDTYSPPADSALILNGIIGEQFEQSLDSKARRGERPVIQTLGELLSGLLFQIYVPGPQSISQGIRGLHAKIIKSTASLLPSEGVIS